MQSDSRVSPVPPQTSVPSRFSGANRSPPSKSCPRTGNGATSSISQTALYVRPPAPRYRPPRTVLHPRLNHILTDSQIVNAGDSMEMLSGGYYKATIHRVFQPPADQRGHTRLGLFFFGYADDDVRLVPFVESPVLQRVGITRKCRDEDAPTMGKWRVARTKVYGVSELQRKDERVEEQVVQGVVVKHYS